MATGRRRTSGVAPWVSWVVAVVCLVAAGFLAWQALRPASGDGLVDLDGRPVVLDDVPDVAAADPVPTGGRFEAPAQGLDVPLVEMNVVDGVINPPTLTDAFLVRGYGDPHEPGSGLVVVAMHAVRGGHAPGNVFFDMGPTDSPVTVRAGDRLIIDGVAFEVTGSEVIGKTVLSASDDIWASWPDRDGEAVILTCLQRATETGSAQDNLVIYARRVG
jgi:hypothetical protein